VGGVECAGGVGCAGGALCELFCEDGRVLVYLNVLVGCICF